MAPADWFTDAVADIPADTFDDASADAVAYGTANNEVVEVANYAVANRDWCDRECDLSIPWNAATLRHVVESRDEGRKAMNLEVRMWKIFPGGAMASKTIQEF